MGHKEIDLRSLSPEARRARERDLTQKRDTWFWHQFKALVQNNGKDFDHAMGRIRDLDHQLKGLGVQGYRGIALHDLKK